MNKKQEFKQLIQSNIDQFGYHVTIVSGAIEPRFAYTIGLTRLFNFELVFAGGIYYQKDDLLQIFDRIVKELKRSVGGDIGKIAVGPLGSFSLSPVDPSWSKMMLLGVFDFYKTDEVIAFQIIPDSIHCTLEVPNMSKELNASSEPVWQWLVSKWDYNGSRITYFMMNCRLKQLWIKPLLISQSNYKNAPFENETNEQINCLRNGVLTEIFSYIVPH